MTTDLAMLVATSLLALAIPVLYLIGRMQVPGGMQWALGNREVPLVVPEWVARAQRAHANLVENLAPFAVLVLTAHLAGRANQWTAYGAALFFVARLAHVGCYTAGLVPLRTLVFFAGTAGEILILLQLF